MIAERFRFYQRNQQADESVMRFSVVQIAQLVRDSSYGVLHPGP